MVLLAVTAPFSCNERSTVLIQGYHKVSIKPLWVGLFISSAFRVFFLGGEGGGGEKLII